MDIGGPETSGSGRPGRGVDVAVWALVIAAMVGIAAAVAWSLSQASFTLREITFEDDAVDVELLIPVAPAPETQPFPAARPLSPEPAAARDPNAEGMTPPAWIRRPAPFYPDSALRRGIERGEVALRCEARASGKLGACEVLSESPAGAGFAEAALASTRQAHVEPRRIDGVRTDGTVAFTIHFRLAPEP